MLLNDVRHRIDGLEIANSGVSRALRVRHRIDGLEMLQMRFAVARFVRHRIDGLEISKPFKHRNG